MAENGVSVSLEDLDRAADEQEPDPTLAEETPKEETPVEEKELSKEEPEKDTLEKEPEEIEEPLDNAERSRLGRRVSAIESSIQTLVDEFRTIMKSAGKDDTPTYDTDLLSDEDGDEYVTKKDLPKFYESQRMREAKEAERIKRDTDKYNNDYNSVFQELGKTVDADFHTEVLQEMKANHNFKRSNSGVLDAELNYLKAKDAILQKKSAGPQNPLDKNKDKNTENLGGPSDTIVTGKADTPVKLDKYAAEFVARVNMSEDSVKKALDGNARTGLMGGKT